MASFVPLSSRISMRCVVGTTADGAEKLGSISLSHIDPAATAEAVDAVVTAMGGLISVPVAEAHKSTVELVSA